MLRPLLIYVFAVLGVLFVAGLGAAGNVRGAWRYMGIWFKIVGGMALVAIVLAIIFS